MSVNGTTQVALVTGGASGMGKATVRRFLDRGMNVVIADLNEKVAEATLAELAAGERVTFVRTDVSREADVEAVVARTVATYGHLDVLVNAAGVGGGVRAADRDRAGRLGLHLRRGARQRVPGHQARRAGDARTGTGGAIVNFGSVGAQAGGIGLQPYSVAKAGVEHLTRMAAYEFAHDRIRVNAVSPGIISTPLIGMGEKELAPVIGTVQPLPYMGRPEYVAAWWTSSRATTPASSPVTS